MGRTFPASNWYFQFKASLKDLLAILQKSLDRALFLYISIHKVRLSGIRASISLVHIGNSTKSNKISFNPDSFLE